MLKVAGCRFFFKDLSTNRICQCLHGSRFTVHGSRFTVHGEEAGSKVANCQLSTVNSLQIVICDLDFENWQTFNLQLSTFNKLPTFNLALPGTPQDSRPITND